MSLEKIVANLVQKVERRFYGKYRGTVVDNADPENLGRLKLQVPSVLGNTVVTGWALPCVPYGGDADQGMLFIPEKGAGVWVEFEEGDLEFPIWVGTFWSKPAGTTELPLPNKPDSSEESAVQSPPTRKIIKTLAGHTIQLEDKQGDEKVLIVERTHKHVIAMNKDGIATNDGVNSHSTVMDSNGVKIKDGVNGHESVMDSKGVKIKDGINGHESVMDSKGVKIKDGLNHHEVTLSGQGIDIKDGTNQHEIKLDSGGVTIQTQTAKIQITPAGIVIDAGAGMVQVKGQPIMLSSSAALPVLRTTDQGIGNLGAPVVITGPGNPMVLA
jgi:hypothetical protein